MGWSDAIDWHEAMASRGEDLWSMLLDYKTFAGTRELTRQALEYAPQVAAYQLALTRALGKPCAQALICFAILGRLVELRIPDPEQLVRSCMPGGDPPAAAPG